MAFNSFNFWLVFPSIFLVYWLIPVRFIQWRKFWLVLVSYLLYMNWKPVFALVLLGVTLTTYGGGRLLDYPILRGRLRKWAAWSCCLLSLFPLLFFKYYNFLNECISVGLDSIGLKFSLPGLNWAIPIGISFYTFQAVGYLLDVYRERIKAEKSLLDYGLFVCFFPQLVSGPISTAEELIPKIKDPHKFDYWQGKEGLKQLLWGMFIKLFIADRLGLYVDTIYSNFAHFSGANCFVASIFYSIQIYCDFAGYSLMAIGVAKTLGFNLVENFHRPYLASNVTDFWRRWHISLTRWLTRHIYIPLGGSRCGKVKTYRNIILTFLVSGIWHGANWTFVVWGVIHGMLLIFEKVFAWQNYDEKNQYVRVARVGFTFLLVNFAWIFFRMPNIEASCEVISKIFGGFGSLDTAPFGGINNIFLSLIGMLILFLKEIKEEFFYDRFLWLRKPLVRWPGYVLILVLIIAFGVLDSGQFIYLNF